MEDCKDFTLHLICVTKFVLDKLQKVPLEAPAFHHNLSEKHIIFGKQVTRTTEVDANFSRVYIKFITFELCLGGR